MLQHQQVFDCISGFSGKTIRKLTRTNERRVLKEILKRFSDCVVVFTDEKETEFHIANPKYDNFLLTYYTKKFKIKKMTNNDALNIIESSPERELINVLKDQIRRSEEAKFAIGYFFLTGFSLVESDFPDKYEKYRVKCIAYIERGVVEEKCR